MNYYPGSSLLLVALLCWLPELRSATRRRLVVKNLPGKKLNIRKAKGEIVIDGKLDGADWLSAVGDFFLTTPVDTAMAEFQTEARVTFDDHTLRFIYLLRRPEGPTSFNHSAATSISDTNDNMGRLIGPHNDAINGFYFIVSPWAFSWKGPYRLVVQTEKEATMPPGTTSGILKSRARLIGGLPRSPYHSRAFVIKAMKTNGTSRFFDMT